MDKSCFIEVGTESLSKSGQRVCGDILLAKRIKEEGRTLLVLSDGLGSGIKASVLSTLTATMALNYISNHMDIEKAASVIMKTLPVCKERRISYATFTIVDINPDCTAQVIEYDNPPVLLLREGSFVPIIKEEIAIKHGQSRPAILYFSRFSLRTGDRIILHSDGLNQSGMGKRATPLGWGEPGVQEYISELVSNEPAITARKLAKALCERALENDGWHSGDDTTCGVIYNKTPRKMLIVTGPPVDTRNDTEIASAVREFQGCTAICGGTTAKIIARELGKSIMVNLRQMHPDVPPPSIMDGIDLVTEGIITMTRAADYLENGIPESSNAAARLALFLMDNDEIPFLVGTRLNEANQVNPGTIELRHSIVRRIAGILEDKYLKRVVIKYI